MAAKQVLEPDIEIEDVDSIGMKADTFGFRHIVMKSYQKCVEEGSKEMTTGGVIKRFINEEEVVVDVVPNQVEIFINSVRMLRNLLFPKINAQKDIGKTMNAFEIKIENMTKKYNERISIINRSFMQKSTNINPDGETERAKAMIPRNQIVNKLKEEFTAKKLLLYKEELFPHLATLLDRYNYFEEMAG